MEYSLNPISFESLKRLNAPFKLTCNETKLKLFVLFVLSRGHISINNSAFY